MSGFVKFPSDFYWGCASSGAQSEGNINKVNDSIWDYWHHIEPERFFNGVGPEVTCNTYTNFKEDIRLMKQLNFNSFRTSIQWSRLIRDFDTCEPDEDGVRFYNAYIDELIANGIEPFITLFHFDMPIALQNRGGWASKEVVDLYVKYVSKAYELFGDRVKKWFTFNEPIVPVEGGYLYKFHYPNEVDFKKAIQAAYNINLASAKAIEAYRKASGDGEIGIVLNLTPSYAASDSVQDLDAAHLADAMFNRSFLDPAIKGSFPGELIELFKAHDIMPETTEEELSIICNNTIDILGVNYYRPRRIQAKVTPVDKSALLMPEAFFDDYIWPDRRMNIYRGWEIFPQAVYDIALNLKENYGNVKWFISENGMGVEGEDRFLDEKGIVSDDYRIDFIKEHLFWLQKGMAAGSNCVGYHLWTFVDNWSWANAFKNRYGYVSLDLESGERTIKKSGYWIAGVIEAAGFEFLE